MPTNQKKISVCIWLRHEIIVGRFDFFRTPFWNSSLKSIKHPPVRSPFQRNINPFTTEQLLRFLFQVSPGLRQTWQYRAWHGTCRAAGPTCQARYLTDFTPNTSLPGGKDEWCFQKIPYSLSRFGFHDPIWVWPLSLEIAYINDHRLNPWWVTPTIV